MDKILKDKEILINIGEISTLLRHYNKNQYEVNLMAIFFDCIENLKKLEYLGVLSNLKKFKEMINNDIEKLDSFNRIHLPKLNEKLDKLIGVLNIK